MQSEWRKYSRQVIDEVLKETEGQPVKERLKAIRDAYPFGSRENHPYAMWLKEQKITKRMLQDGIVKEG